MRGWRECLAALGYRFQFITLAGWHALNLSMFELASAYRDRRHARIFPSPATRVRQGSRRLSRPRATRLSWARATSMPCRQRLHPGSFRRAPCKAAPSRHNFMSAALLDYVAEPGGAGQRAAPALRRLQLRIHAHHTHGRRNIFSRGTGTPRARMPFSASSSTIST